MSFAQNDPLTTRQLDERVDDAIRGIKLAKKQGLIYNLETREVQDFEGVAIWLSMHEDGFVDPGVAVAGFQDDWDRLRSLINLKIRMNSRAAMGSFATLPDNVIMRIFSEMSPDDILALCATSATFRARCNKMRVYEFLSNSIFPDSVKNRDESYYSHFTKLWRSRVTVDDFQSLRYSDLSQHPNDVEMIFKDYVKNVETFQERFEDDDRVNFDVISNYTAIDILFLMQYPRPDLLEQFDFDIDLIRLWQNTDDVGVVEEVLSNMFMKGVNFRVPHVEIGISHRDYLDLLSPISPPADLRKDDWMSQLNSNIMSEIVRNDDIDSTEDLKALLTLESSDPYYFWIWFPFPQEFQAALENAWILLLDFRANNMSQDEILKRLVNYNFVQQSILDGQDVFYNPDFDVIYSFERVQELLELELISDENVDFESGIVGDVERFEDIWLEKFESMVLL